MPAPEHMGLLQSFLAQESLHEFPDRIEGPTRVHEKDVGSPLRVMGLSHAADLLREIDHFPDEICESDPLQVQDREDASVVFVLVQDLPQEFCDVAIVMEKVRHPDLVRFQFPEVDVLGGWEEVNRRGRRR